ncbi:hypothetical protein EDEG_02210 [Edhazardia aedis USNM 41457]|uniref:Uncharacterized protein n=1 Tax=Edhazardia aedis (strain USNM 41457) TaxID=1003232 RepID=J9DLH8_EDHAE|nr:hypothetical protein EDEG_02210 [Edhazardia aedis USNM 41457]|eukprot:EJW03445.1 hypothetical protein EDEG_02210 [Edhazardia aedis USNM 41457]
MYEYEIFAHSLVIFTSLHIESNIFYVLYIMYRKELQKNESRKKLCDKYLLLDKKCRRYFLFRNFLYFFFAKLYLFFVRFVKVYAYKEKSIVYKIIKANISI